MPVYRGPQPYSELDERIFYGRDSEKNELTELIVRNRLSILTAPSGVGKTSLLLAGVVPKLRQQYEAELSAESIVLGPTLVCRTWSGSARRSPDRILVDSVTSAVVELEDRGKTAFLKSRLDAANVARLKDKAHALASVVANSKHTKTEHLDWLGLMDELADVGERIVLLFDQFEDALRLPVDGGRGVLQAIASLFHQEPRVRIMLSLRHEYVMSLHDLEVALGGLAKRTYYLQSMTTAAISEIVIAPAKLEEIHVDDSAVETIKGWLKEVRTSSEYDDDGDEPLTIEEQDEDTSLQLLPLQALLVDVYKFLCKNKQRRVIDDSILKEYVKELRIDSKELATRALENHIQKVLTREDEDEPARDLDQMATDATQDEKNRLLRRLFARMPPHLTSGSRPGSPGYKNQVPLRKLIKEVLKENLEALNVALDAAQLDDLLAFVKNPTRFVDYRRIGPRATSDVFSGRARRSGWGDDRTANVLVLALAELLRRLVNGNVLKPLGTGGESAYELVHDGLGPALLNWAERFQSGLEDALASVIRLNGLTFRWPEGAFEKLSGVDNAFWSGCIISDQDFTNVVFSNCDLRGTMFSRCTFRGGGFDNCNLDGAMFIASKFFADGNQPCEFKGGQMQSALFRSCLFYNALMDGLILDGTVFVDSDLLGKLVIRNSSLEVVVFRDSTHEESDGDEFVARGVFITRCDFIFSRIICDPGVRKTSPVYLNAAVNNIFPDDRALYAGNPPKVFLKRTQA